VTLSRAGYPATARKYRRTSLPGPIRVYPGPSESTRAYPSLPGPIRVYPGPSESTRAYPSLPGPIRVYPGPSESTRAYPSLPGPIRVYPGPSESTRAYPSQEQRRGHRAARLLGGPTPWEGEAAPPRYGRGEARESERESH
jgi:hypothetical protein